MKQITRKPQIGEKLIYRNGSYNHEKRFTVVSPPSPPNPSVPFSDRIIGMLFENGKVDIINWISGDGVINPLLYTE